MRLIDVDALNEKLGITPDCDECEYSSCGFLCTKTGDFVDACEAIQTAPIVEECEDAISRSALIDAHYEYCNEHSNDYSANFYVWSLKLMENAPTVQPSIDKDYLVNLILESVYDGDACKRLLDLVDRPKGEWISNHDGSWNCSECGLRVFIYAKGNYCPNCGVRMEK